MNDDADYLWDRSGDDPELARLERALAGFAHDAPLREPWRRRRRGLVVSALVVAAAAAVVLALALARAARARSWRAGPRRARRAPWRCAGGDGFPFRSAAGSRARGSTARAPDGARGVLRVGAWLETEPGATADLQVADIGAIRLRAASRLRLVASGPDQHRLELARGRLSAQVTAPPRLFVIDTPVGAAVDLGCAYDLSVDDAGRTHLRVTAGAVSLEGRGHAAWVPWGYEVDAEPGRGPGTPRRSDAPERLRAAVLAFDAAAGEGAAAGAALSVILDDAGAADAPLLWNLLPRTAGGDRAAVFARLDELTLRPEWVLDEDVLAAEPVALERWRQSLEGERNVGGWDAP
ncbi:MAG: FecR domain-containing protein [Kofleriaceae bacterium]|nr:FecR domain-containing protein [Kofleriaceae bacterium]